MNNNELRMPSYDLTGKVAIVTGGTKGIGHAIAVTLANFGADVVVSSRTAADCEKIQKEIEAMGRRCLGIACNVGVEGDVENMVNKTVETFGRLDILVNNAGIGGKTAPIFEQDSASWDAVLNTNLKGMFMCGKAAAEYMKDHGGGRIINIASVAGRIGQKNVAPYVAAKSGAIGLTKTMANEWAR